MKDALVGTAATQYVSVNGGQIPEVQKDRVCAHSALYCPGGIPMKPFLSPLQEDGKFLLPTSC